MSLPVAYHITVGAYGARLHGDDRGTVDTRMNRPGEPILGRNEHWQRIEQRLMKHPPVELSGPQRAVLEALVPRVCGKGDWTHHIAAAQPDHIHVLLSATHESRAAAPRLTPGSSEEGTTIRRLLKRWLSEELSRKWRLPPDARWWVDAGSVKWVWTRDYFANVFDYIRRQRLTPFIPPRPEDPR